jgi:hypothetical protein
LYGRLAEAEPNANLAELGRKLAETEVRQVALWEGRLAEAGAAVPAFRPSLKAGMTAIKGAGFNAWFSTYRRPFAKLVTSIVQVGHVDCLSWSCRITKLIMAVAELGKSH